MMADGRTWIICFDRHWMLDECDESGSVGIIFDAIHRAHHILHSAHTSKWSEHTSPLHDGKTLKKKASCRRFARIIFAQRYGH